MHALSARPHNRVGGREFSLYADGMELYFLLFLLAVLGLYLVGGLTHMRSMCVGVAETGHRGEVPALTGWKENFLFCLLTVLGFYIVGELTHMRSMCVGVAETGVEHCSPAKILKETFPLSYFCMTKSTKSHQRERSPLFENSSRVHELVAGSSAWQVCAAKDKVKIGSFATPRNLILPRVRTYHTK